MMWTVMVQIQSSDIFPHSSSFFCSSSLLLFRKEPKVPQRKRKNGNPIETNFSPSFFSYVEKSLLFHKAFLLFIPCWRMQIYHITLHYPAFSQLLLCSAKLIKIIYDRNKETPMINTKPTCSRIFGSNVEEDEEVRDYSSVSI